jgi:hypothetical protein
VLFKGCRSPTVAAMICSSVSGVFALGESVDLSSSIYTSLELPERGLDFPSWTLVVVSTREAFEYVVVKKRLDSDYTTKSILFQNYYLKFRHQLRINDI